MSQPTPFVRGFNFTDFATVFPTSPPPGVRIDAELDAAALTLSQVLANLALIQRDDGRLANASVRLATLHSEVIAAFALAGVEVLTWATATAYTRGQVVIDSDDVYLVAIAHTSGVLATDVTAEKMIRVFDSGIMSSLAGDDGAALVGFIDTGTGVVARTLQAMFRDLPINPKSFGAVGDGATNNKTAIDRTVAAAIAQGRNIEFPPGIFRVDTSVPIRRSDWLSYATAFAPGLRIDGAGPGVTIFDFRGSNSALFDIAPDHDFVTFKSLLGVSFKGFTIRTGGAPTAAGGIKFRSCMNIAFEDLHIVGLSGNGIEAVCTAGDPDGSVGISYTRVRVENCAGWGVSNAASTGHNEISNTSAYDLEVQACGTAEEKAITSFTGAGPGVFTATAHGFASDTEVRVGGTNKTAVNGARYRLKWLSANTFKLQTGSTALGWTDLDTTSIGAGTGGHVWPAEPSSGGVKWKGQVASFHGFAALCKNAGFYIPGEGGLAQDCDLGAFALENNGLIAALVTGISNFGMLPKSQLYQNSFFSPAPAYHGLLLDGTNDTVRVVSTSRVEVRNTVNETAFEAFTVIGANADVQSMKFEDTIWKADGWAGQTRFSSNIRFAPIPQQCELRLVDDSTWLFGPNGNGGQHGNVTPIRLRAGTNGNVTTGEWIARHISSGGITLSNASGADGSAVAASTTYNVYIYDAGSTSNATPTCSTDVPVLDGVSGYEVRTGDASQLFVGRVRTAAGNAGNGHPAFETTNLGWLNPLRMPDPVPGTPAWGFVNSATRRFYVKTAGTRPSNAADGTFGYLPSVEYSLAGVAPGSIAAGATYSTTITSGVTAEIGAKVIPTLSVSTAGLILFAAVTASNTITVYYYNPTGGGIDPGSHTLYAEVFRR